MPVYTPEQMLAKVDELRNMILELVDQLPEYPDESGDVGPGDETDYEPEVVTSPSEDDEVAIVRSIGERVLGDLWPKGFDDPLMIKVFENTRGDLTRIEAAFILLEDGLSQGVIRSPGGYLYTTSKQNNLIDLRNRLENRSELEVASVAVQTARRKADEKIKGRPLRGTEAKPKKKPNFRDLAEQLRGVKSGQRDD